MRHVDVGQVRLAVREAGAGEPVVLLHGFPELSYSWRHQLPALADAGFHAVAPDLRGYGGSDRPDRTEDYALPRLVEDVVGLIRALGHESAHLVGHDWGGSMAWSTAARAPERVRSLTILNSPHPVASAEARRIPEQQRRSWYMLLFQFAGVAEEWLSQDDYANLRRFVFDTAAPGTFTEEDRETYVDALRQDGALTAALRYYRANIPPETWLRPPPDLPPVTARTMIVWGEDDTYMSPMLLERSIEKVAGPLRVERLPFVSHWVQQEAPDAVNRLLVDFLRG
ncbi:MAG: alpha/beta hydrolase [Actinomycetota bacterium]